MCIDKSGKSVRHDSDSVKLVPDADSSDNKCLSKQSLKMNPGSGIAAGFPGGKPCMLNSLNSLNSHRTNNGDFVVHTHT